MYKLARRSVHDGRLRVRQRGSPDHGMCSLGMWRSSALEACQKNAQLRNCHAVTRRSNNFNPDITFGVLSCCHNPIWSYEGHGPLLNNNRKPNRLNKPHRAPHSVSPMRPEPSTGCHWSTTGNNRIPQWNNSSRSSGRACGQILQPRDRTSPTQSVP